MANRYNRWIVIVSLFAVLALALTLVRPNHAEAQAQDQHPILDKVADKVIQKYQTSTCEDLWKKKSEKAPPSAEEQKAIAFLRRDRPDATPIYQQSCGADRKQDV